jgi:rare lipoprotein A (peptidoglycan hydrolase)
MPTRRAGAGGGNCDRTAGGRLQLAAANERIQRDRIPSPSPTSAADVQGRFPLSNRRRWYYPAIDYNYDEIGVASWYGEEFDQQYTANGEIFDLNQLTAAHRTLPMPSIVQVTNLAKGRSMQLRVNDRGPFARGRDVSRRAAQLLGFETNGAALVRVSIIKGEGIRVAELAKRNGGDIGVLVAEAPSVAAVEAAARTRQPLGAPAPPPPAAPVNAVPALVAVAALPRLPEKSQCGPGQIGGTDLHPGRGILGPGERSTSPVAHRAARKRASHDRVDKRHCNVPSTARAAAQCRASRSASSAGCRWRLSPSTDCR